MMRTWLYGLVTTAVLAAMSFHLRTKSSALAGAGPDSNPTSSATVDTRRIDRAAPGRRLIPEVIALSFGEWVDDSCIAGRWHMPDCRPVWIVLTCSSSIAVVFRRTRPDRDPAPPDARPLPPLDMR